jgi:hypothetical protein
MVELTIVELNLLASSYKILQSLGPLEAGVSLPIVLLKGDEASLVAGVANTLGSHHKNKAQKAEND